MNLREQLLTLQGRVDELSLRERGILFLVLTALIYFIVDSALIAPQEQEQKRLLGEIGKVRGEITQLEQQAVTVLQRHNEDPDAAENRQLTQLETTNHNIAQQIELAVNGLIEPRQMAQALESVLKQQRKLRFVRVENINTVPLLGTTPPTEETPDTVTRPATLTDIYKHGMRIELEGSYPHILDYVRALEALPWQFHWESVRLTVQQYPNVRAVITVNTLSLSEGWIGV